MVSQKPTARREFRRFKGRKSLDFEEVDAGRRLAEALQGEVASRKHFAELHPAHALYVYAQNQAAVLSEQTGTDRTATVRSGHHSPCAERSSER